VATYTRFFYRRLCASTALALVFEGNLETGAALMRAGLIIQHDTLHQQPVALCPPLRR
jgi:hypothetical protein